MGDPSRPWLGTTADNRPPREGPRSDHTGELAIPTRAFPCSPPMNIAESATMKSARLAVRHLTPEDLISSLLDDRFGNSINFLLSTGAPASPAKRLLEHSDIKS